MSNRLHSAIIAILILVACSVSCLAQDNQGAWEKKKPAWVLLSPSERTQAQDFSEDFKAYLNVSAPRSLRRRK
jgi:hypothetical protein